MTTLSNKRRLFLGSAIAGAIALGSIAYAGPNCKHGGGKHGKYGQDNTEFMQKRLERMSSKLGLSETQKTQMQSLMQNQRNLMKPLRDEKRGLRKEMKALDPTAADYPEKLADIANRKAELVRQMTIAHGNKRQQMAGILTPEQRAMKQQMREQRKAKYLQKYQDQ